MAMSLTWILNSVCSWLWWVMTWIIDDLSWGIWAFCITINNIIRMVRSDNLNVLHLLFHRILDMPVVKSCQRTWRSSSDQWLWWCQTELSSFVSNLPVVVSSRTSCSPRNSSLFTNSVKSSFRNRYGTLMFMFIPPCNWKFWIVLCLLWSLFP